MKSLLFLCVPFLVFGSVSNQEFFACDHGDYSVCADIGVKYLSSFDSSYDPDKGAYSLKRACNFGKNGHSCFRVGSYYDSIRDSQNAFEYYKKGCSLNNSTACFYYNLFVKRGFQ